MPNTNPEAIRVANERIRLLADRIMQLYNHMKVLQIQATDQGWLVLFPADNEVIEDGSAIDGRQSVTNQIVRDLLLDVAAYITDMETNGNARRNKASIISVNPERE